MKIESDDFHHSNANVPEQTDTILNKDLVTCTNEDIFMVKVDHDDLHESNGNVSDTASELSQNGDQPGENVTGS